MECDMVTHLRAVVGDDTEPRWWPIVGPQHDDKEIIGFDYKHAHIDYRYLDEVQKDVLDSFPYSMPGVHPVFFHIITVVRPDTGSYVDPITRLYAPDGVMLRQLPSPSIPKNSYLRVLPKVQIQNYPTYPYSRMEWHAELEEWYANERIDSGMICPHRGASLKGLEPDDHGNITCPLHGLCWNLESGEMVRMSEESVFGIRGILDIG